MQGLPDSLTDSVAHIHTVQSHSQTGLSLDTDPPTILVTQMPLSVARYYTTYYPTYLWKRRHVIKNSHCILITILFVVFSEILKAQASCTQHRLVTAGTDLHPQPREGSINIHMPYSNNNHIPYSKRTHSVSVSHYNTLRVQGDKWGIKLAETRPA